MSDEREWSIDSLIENRVNAALNLVDETRQLLKHAPSMGSAREAFVRELLEEFIPESFRVESGFAASSEGLLSSQQDVLVVRGDRLRRLASYAGFSVHPIENVYATIEVKTAVKPYELAGALDQLQSVKTLYPERPGFVSMGSIVTTGTIHPVFAGLIAIEGPSVEGALDSFRDFHRNHGGRRINAVLVFASPDGGYLIGWSDNQGRFVPTPDEGGESMGQLQASIFSVGNADPPAAMALRAFLALLLTHVESHDPPLVDLRSYLWPN